MDIIMQANRQKFQEVKPMMCNALKELMKDELEESRKAGLEAGIQDRILADFNLSAEQIQGYIAKYWKL